MKYFLPCSSIHPCGKGSTAYTHRLNPSNIQAFRRFVQKWAQKRRPCDPEGLNFSHLQLCSWQRLKHWGLIQKVDDDARYIVTPLGLDFYNGLVQLNDVVATINDERIPDDHEAWLTHGRKPRKTYIWQVDASGYKPKQEYIQEASRQSSIFSLLSPSQ